MRNIVGERLARIDAEIAALGALKRELTHLIDAWDATLAVTPIHTPARLLDTLAGVPAGCAKKSR